MKLLFFVSLFAICSSIFSMDNTREVVRQKWLFIGALHVCQTAVLKAEAYREDQQYQQEAQVKRQNLKTRFPQDIELLENGKACYRYIAIDGTIEKLIL